MLRLDMDMLRGLPKSGPTDPSRVLPPTLGRQPPPADRSGLAMLRDRRFVSALETIRTSGLDVAAPRSAICTGSTSMPRRHRRATLVGVRASLVRSVYGLRTPTYLFLRFRALHEYQAWRRLPGLLRPGASAGHPVGEPFMEVCSGPSASGDRGPPRRRQVAVATGFSVMATNPLMCPACSTAGSSEARRRLSLDAGAPS
jgi:hypothetical protein